MCGLVFAGGRYSLNSADVELFAKLLYVDTFRGEHSTGVFSLFKPYGQGITTRVVKEALPGPFFLANDSLWEQCSSMEYITPTTRAKSSAFPKVMFGHNRYATRGKINSQNAHPFVHGHITLAHNGTLRDQSLLPDYRQFEVDSENVCYSIAKIGADETIQKLKGAFTLIWHDAQLNTLNIIRNTERPFHLAELTTGDWFGASEEWMLMGILGRGKSPKSVRRHFETEVGVQYIFDVTDGCRLVEEKKHTLPSFPVTTYQGRGGYYEDAWEAYYREQRSSYTRRDPKPEQESKKTLPATTTALTASNALMQKYGLSWRIGDTLPYDMLTSHPYTGPVAKNKGCIKGWLSEENDYIEVHEHNTDTSGFEEDRVRKCVITSCFEVNCLLTILGRPLTEEEKKAADWASELLETFEDLVEDDPEEQEVCASGEVFTRDEWKESHYDMCANCTKDIAFEDVPSAHILVNTDVAVCEQCYRSLVDADLPEEEEVELETFNCKECKHDYLKDQESSKEDLCRGCYEKLTAIDPTAKVTIGNGWTVSCALWSKMNDCVKCHSKISFAEAGLVEFRNGSPLCLKCSRRTLEKK